MRYSSLALIGMVLASASAFAGGKQVSSGAVVLDGTKVREMLQQCSRSTPAPGEATWQPTAADIAMFEAAIPGELAARHNPADPDGSKFVRGWRRQYVGIVRGGRRFIYGNFFPHGQVVPRDRWLSDPFVVCDGGHAFFGAEFDVRTNHITHIAFNGMA